LFLYQLNACKLTMMARTLLPLVTLSLLGQVLANYPVADSTFQNNPAQAAAEAAP
jgi:hypothetical protein